MARMSRDKGARIELEMVERHRGLGLKCERVSRTGYSGIDLDVYVDGPGNAPLIAEVKARAAGEGFKILERWLGDADILLLRRDRAEPLVVLPWASWSRLLRRR